MNKQAHKQTDRDDYNLQYTAQLSAQCKKKQEFVRPRWPYDMRPLHVCHCNS